MEGGRGRRREHNINRFPQCLTEYSHVSFPPYVAIIILFVVSNSESTVCLLRVKSSGHRIKRKATTAND